MKLLIIASVLFSLAVVGAVLAIGPGQVARAGQAPAPPPLPPPPPPEAPPIVAPPPVHANPVIRIPLGASDYLSFKKGNGNFVPSTIAITKGSTVTFRNEEQSSVVLTVRKNLSSIDTYPIILQTQLLPGKEVDLTLNEQGEYLVATQPWPWMRADIVVR